MKYPNYLDLDYLRTLENQPTFFGLGFIQLKVDDQQRLHFWHPETRTPDYDEEWHDHRYSFSSQVLVGSLTNEIAYGEMNKKGDHEVWEVCCKGNGAERVGSGNIHYLTRMVTEAGQAYFLDRDAMHKSHSEKAMTMQTRHAKNHKLKARIMTKEYNSPNPFDLSMPVSRIWDIIDDVIGKPGYHSTTEMVRTISHCCDRIGGIFQLQMVSLVQILDMRPPMSLFSSHKISVRLVKRVFELASKFVNQRSNGNEGPRVASSVSFHLCQCPNGPTGNRSIDIPSSISRRNALTSNRSKALRR